MINYSIQGWMSGPELMWLHETAKQMQSVLEIGSFMGRSTYALCTGCKETVIAVDKFLDPTGFLYKGDFYPEFYKNVGHFPNLVTIRSDSVTASQFFKPKSIDMIFIDGSHHKADVILDVALWTPICNKIMCGHDLRPGSEIEPALKELDIKYEIAVDSIWKCEII